ncbi:MAG: CGNR zinc finger domain-containing protein [Gemmatimonadaceae bacterium]
MSGDVERARSQFFGGRVCLDFANTLDWRTSPQPVELIPDYRALLDWSHRRGTLPRLALGRLAKRHGHTRGGSAAMSKAIALRAEIWAICDALVSSAQPDLTRFNSLLAMAPPQPRIVQGRAGLLHELKGHDPVEPLCPILWSMSAMLTSIDAQRMGVCEAGGCGWFFVDESPNQSRRWCSSEICGNRERVRRSYAKRNETAPLGQPRHISNAQPRRDG